MGNKKNDSAIFNLMKPLWNEQMSESDTEPVTNPALFTRIKESIWLEKQKAAQRKIPFMPGDCGLQQFWWLLW
jgi:hypothetical protein